jgi:hypothetical protein
MRANAPPAPRVSMANGTQPIRVGSGQFDEKEVITSAEALETSPSRFLHLFVSEYISRGGSNPPVLSAAAKKTWTGARLQRRLVTPENVIRSNAVAGEKRARGALG